MELGKIINYNTYMCVFVCVHVVPLYMEEELKKEI